MQRKYFYLLFLPFFMLAFKQSVHAQSTFQKIYSNPDSLASLQTFDAKSTTDGGYVIAGLASEYNTSTFHPFIAKLDCDGLVQWQKFFGSTQSISNVNTKVIETANGDYVLISNLGTNQNYNGFAIRCDASGNILWQKLLNLSNGSQSDIVNDVKETTDGHLILTGAGKGTPDVLLTKLQSNGTLLWSKLYGTSGFFDEGSAILELKDGNYLLTGRYVSMGTFNAFLMKTDTSGNVLWFKCYGDTLHHMRAMDIKEFSNGDILMGGSTTLRKTNFQSFSDNFIMRLSSTGDTLWTKVFHGSAPNDSYENVSSVLITIGDTIVACSATASYASGAIVPNKQALMMFTPNGNLTQAYIYNQGYSHYPRIMPHAKKGFLLSGFSTAYTGPVKFSTLLIRLNSALETACNRWDVKNTTQVEIPNFKITIPAMNISNEGTIANNTSSYVGYIEDSTLCIQRDALVANFDTSKACLGSPYTFQYTGVGAESYSWQIDSQTFVTASPTYTFTSSGMQTVKLVVSNGCYSDSISKQIQVIEPPNEFSLGADTSICQGANIQLSVNAPLAEAYQWSDGSSNQSLMVSTAGTYILQADYGVCGTYADTISVQVINCDTSTVPNCNLFVPNAFSPNGDGVNETFKPRLPLGSAAILRELAIYNRWGNRVFSTNDWNATWNGSNLASDTYFVIIRYTCNQIDEIYKGDLLLIR